MERSLGGDGQVDVGEVDHVVGHHRLDQADAAWSRQVTRRDDDRGARREALDQVVHQVEHVATGLVESVDDDDRRQPLLVCALDGSDQLGGVATPRVVGWDDPRADQLLVE